MKSAARKRVGLAVALAAALAVAALALVTFDPWASDDSLNSPPALPEWVVYWNDNPWPSIWAVRLDGSNNHRILPNEQNAKRPRLSPDRQWVAFDGAPPGERVLSDFDIQLIRLDGSGLRTLTNTGDWDMDAQWSPDGTQIAFTRSPPSQEDTSKASIWVVPRDGGPPRRIASGASPRWSPDGTSFVYGAGNGRDLMLVGADGTNPRVLLKGPENRLQFPAGWSPDGETILFTQQRGRTGQFGEVFLVDADGENVRHLGAGRAACWSPSGREILYTRTPGSRLYVMDADGSNKRELARIVASEPHWR